jgi:hypothetical protein
MFPQHILDDLGPDDRVAVLAREGELYFWSTGRPTARPMCGPAPGGRGPRWWPRTCGTREILDLVAERKRNPGGQG